MTQPANAAFLDYRVRWRAGDARPGKHAARQSGRDGDFRAYRPFWQMPDAQRIDVRRSIMDPFGGVMVRQTAQRSSITLMLAADLSRSMAPPDIVSALPDIAALAQAASRSAVRAGDAFGFIGFDEIVRPNLSTPPGRRRDQAASVAGALTRFQPVGRHARGILDLAAHLPPQRCLVLLVSDFLMDLAVIDTALLTLARHDVVPVIMSAAGHGDLPRYGLMRLRDAETGQVRLLLLRPALQKRWRNAAQNRRQALDLLFRRHGCTPFHGQVPLDIAALSQHLLQR